MWEFIVAVSATRQATLTSDFRSWVNQHGLNILIILLGAWLLRRFSTVIINKIVQRTVRGDLYPTEIDRKKRATTLSGLVDATIRIAVWFLAIIMIINELGINTTPLIASAGVVGITLGFGAQSLIKDFVSGIFIIIENQYRVGDVVQLGDVSGSVEAITMRTTIVRDMDGRLHHIPNGTISRTTNMTVDFANINESILVGRNTDIERLEHVINHVGEEMASIPDLKHMIKEPPHFLRIEGFQRDGIEVRVVGRTIPGEQWVIKGQLYSRLQKAFKAHGIDIPYQQVEVHQTHKKTS